jgi:plastocyanin
MTSSSRGIVFAALGLGIAAILTAGLAIYYSTIASDQTTNEEPTISTITQPTADREFHLFSEVDENINEEELGIPPDKFSSETIIVNQGDTVEIHFYNLEPVETQEKHSFTIPSGTYQMHHDVGAGDDVEIELVANEAGVYEFQCVYHLPTMQGKLVVLPATR